MIRQLRDFLAKLFAAPRPVVCASDLFPVPSGPSQDIGAVQQLVSRVSELTTSVAHDVSQHNTNVQAISTELSAVASSDPAAVAAIVCKLLLANQELQGRLERAEQTLQSHARQLDEAVSSARTDSLTGLFNRRALDDELRRALTEYQRRGKPAALMMLDVDYFKKFNDTNGHLAGDQALIHVGRALATSARSEDVVARFGGEEFAVIFAGATANEVRDQAETMRRAIGTKPVVYDGQQIQISASAGLSELSADDSAADWVKRADSALYAAKNAGRNCGFINTHSRCERLDFSQTKIAGSTGSTIESSSEQAAVPEVVSMDAELASEAFIDTTFVPSIARRIAEWKRGGATLTILLARLDVKPGNSDANESGETPPIRAAMSAARQCIRDMDLLTRWQSDGLALLLPGSTAKEARAVARRLRAALAGKSDPSAVSMSVGMAEGIEGNDAKRVLERAWLALGAASRSGRGNVYVHDGVKTAAVKFPAPV